MNKKTLTKTINKLKNRYYWVRKRVKARAAPLLLAVMLLIGAVVTPFMSVKATGMEPALYYTLYDALVTIMSVTGADVKFNDLDTSNTILDSDYWESVYNGFKIWQEQQAFDQYDVDALYKEGIDKMKKDSSLYQFCENMWDKIYDAFCNATSDGISLPQDVYDYLRLTNEAALRHPEIYNTSGMTKEQFSLHIANLVGYKGDDATYCFWVNSSDPQYYTIMKVYWRGDYYYLVGNNSRKYLYYEHGVMHYYDPLYGEVGSAGVSGTMVSMDGRIIVGPLGNAPTFSEFIYKNIPAPAIAPPITIDAAQPAPQQVPLVLPWIIYPDIPDEVRTTPTPLPDPDPDKDPDEDPDKKPEFLPAIVPQTTPTEKPSETEDPSEKPDNTEGTNPKPDGGILPGIQVNPATGNVIDPISGWDIDPATGLLINPETGELVRPEDAPGGGGGSGGGFGGLPNITDIYPFCIPKDIVSLIKGSRATAKAPVWTFSYTFKSFNYTWEFTVDMSDYERYVRIFREGFILLFIVGLWFLTLRVNKIFI